MRTILLIIFAIMCFGTCISCGTFVTVNSPYHKAQLLWNKKKTENYYIFNNYYRVKKRVYDTYKVGDKFEFKKGDLQIN